MARKKIRLPRDRNDKPIDIGDVLAWKDGDVLVVAVLNYYGDGKEHGGYWTAEDENGKFSDNIERSTIVSKSRKGRKKK